MPGSSGPGVEQTPAAPARTRVGSVYAALDLGTNNCRLLIATPTSRGFRIIDAYSRIIRLGEGLIDSGRLSQAAMDRAYAALSICADRMRKRGVTTVRAVATQACRSAANGDEFIAEVKRRTGIELSVISPREEAHLAVAGCANLIDPADRAALVLDVGGGSTELSWVNLRHPQLRSRNGRLIASSVRPHAWVSMPIGVVNLAERFPERPHDEGLYGGMVQYVRDALRRFEGAGSFRRFFSEGEAHLVGTSGAITSLAGVHLGLSRYDRKLVDGLWMTRWDCDAARDSLRRKSRDERAAIGCIGSDRADLVLAGAAILEAVLLEWPCPRVRVADRGLREGMLMSLMARERRRMSQS
jgi:exopolyphosphatase / guanosine-5'-triphosphate,3'-diphosphate pyrophosphatase